MSCRERQPTVLASGSIEGSPLPRQLLRPEGRSWVACLSRPVQHPFIQRQPYPAGRIAVQDPPRLHRQLHMQALVHHDDVGVLAHRQNSPAVLHLQNPRRIERRHLRRLRQRGPRCLHHRPQRLVHRQRAARQRIRDPASHRAVNQVRPAVADPHRLAGELVEPVRHPRGPDCIADQDDLVVRLDLQEQLQHRRMHVHRVGDHLDEQLIAKQRAHQNARLAVMHGPHGVKDVRNAFQAVVDRLRHLLVGRLAVADLQVDAVHGGIASDLESSRNLRRDRHHLDAGVGPLVHPMPGLQRRLPHEVLADRPMHLGVHERPLKVQALKDPGRPVGLAGRHQPVKGFKERFFELGIHRRQQRGRPASGVKTLDPGKPLQIRRGKVFAATAVDVNVDESRQDVPADQIDPQGIRRRAHVIYRAKLDDLAVLDDHRRVRLLPVRGDRLKAIQIERTRWHVDSFRTDVATQTGTPQYIAPGGPGGIRAAGPEATPV